MVTISNGNTGTGVDSRLWPSLNLSQENRVFVNTGGVSKGNRERGFQPAFLETRSGKIYPSRFADGRLAPVHVLEGLPPALVTRRTSAGRVSATITSVVSGFVRAGQFYTREQTAKLTAQNIF